MNFLKDWWYALRWLCKQGMFWLWLVLCVPAFMSAGEAMWHGDVMSSVAWLLFTIFLFTLPSFVGTMKARNYNFKGPRVWKN